MMVQLGCEAPGTGNINLLRVLSVYVRGRLLQLVPLLRTWRLPQSAAAEPLPGMAMHDTFEAFKYRDYRLLWIGNLCTTIAVWIQTTTMSWVAYALTGSGSTPRIWSMCMRTIPTLLVTPIAGVAVDRFDRKQNHRRQPTVLIHFRFSSCRRYLPGRAPGLAPVSICTARRCHQYIQSAGAADVRL